MGMNIWTFHPSQQNNENIHDIRMERVQQVEGFGNPSPLQVTTFMVSTKDGNALLEGWSPKNVQMHLYGRWNE